MGNQESRATSITLLEQLQHGDSEAWERFHSIYAGLIYARCRNCGLDPEDACDVTQDVLISVSRSITTFRKGEREPGFRNWLRRIASNAIVDFYRKSRRQPASAGGSSAREQLESQPDPFDDDAVFSAGDDALALVLQQALERIRPDYKPTTWDAFVRTTLEDQPPANVAHDLGLTPAAVRQAKYKILKRLRDEWGDLLDS